jgi:hypothetical protein
VQTRGGIRILPDRIAQNWPSATRLPAVGNRLPANALNDALGGITGRYGRRTADFVASQLEYPVSSAWR